MKPCWSWRACWVIAVGIVIVGCGCRGPAEPVRASGPGFAHARSDQGIAPEEAFRLGLQSIGEHIDLRDGKWQVNFRRMEQGGWLMVVTRFPAPGKIEVEIIVEDDGSVKVIPGM